MLILRRNGVVRERLFSFSGCLLSCQFLYSTASSSSSSSSSSKEPHLIVDYLVDSLGFSRQAAISASSKVKVTPYLKSPKNADLVVNLFKDYGLDNAQINDIISFDPKILHHKGNKTIEPKLKFFRELGLSGSDLVKLNKKNPNLLKRGLSTKLIPTINYLRQLLGNDETVIQAISNPGWLFSSNDGPRRIPANVSLLQRHGISNDKIKQFVLRRPVIFHLATELLEERMHYVQEQLGIPWDSPTFMDGLTLSVGFSRSTIEDKMQVFKSFGWSDSEISALLRVHPLVFARSAAAIHDKLNFFMKTIGYTASDMINATSGFTYSLEGRVKPRFRILKILKEKKLVNNKPCLNTVLPYSDLKFLRFLRCFESDIPGLCEDYMNSTRTISKTE